MIGISPKRIQVVYQSEFTTKDLDIWANENNINLAFSRAEQPMYKSYIELFNGSFRYDCLNLNWFMKMEVANEKIEEYRHEYNH